MVFGVLCAMSFSYLADWHIHPLGEINFFNIFDYCSSNILLPFGGMLISIFFGWKLDRKYAKRILTTPPSRFNVVAGFTIFILKYIAPVLIFVIFLANC